jgi:hypothetical protein
MGGKGGAPAAPDYSMLALSSQHAADVNAQTSREQLDWAKQQYADQKPITDSYMKAMTQNMTDASENARQAQDYYKSTYQPIETQFAKTAEGYNTPARAAQVSAAAQTDVANTFAGQRAAALSNLESYGIDPSQTRYGALDLGTRISQAAAQAQAGTQSRLNTEATGLALQGEAINVGRGYPGQVAQAYGTATGAGGAGVTAGLNTSQTYGNMMGNPTTWAGLASADRAGAVNTLNTGFQNQLGSFNANAAVSANQSSGIGGLVGAGIVGGAIII